MEAGGAGVLGTGTRLGPYRLGETLGTGGMGTVYVAEAERDAPGVARGSRVAVKVVHPHLLATPGFFKRFVREGEIGKAVRHENVVRTYDADALALEEAQHHFLVMEYVEGQTLRDLLAELDRVPEGLCRHIGVEVAKGLAAIHAAGVIHRDLKPENIIISLSEAKPDEDVAERPSVVRSRDGSHREGNVPPLSEAKPDEDVAERPSVVRSRDGSLREGNVQPQYDHVVKIMDLGVARLANELIRLSQTGAFVGSLHYAAPESFRKDGADIDGRLDLHSLGLVLYELACGVHPYLADDVRGTVRRVLHEKPRRLGDVNPQLSPFFEEVVHTLLEKDREARFGTAAELHAVLEAGEQSSWWRGRATVIRAATMRPLRRIRIPRETAVYGRDDELARLRSLFAQALAGDGQVVLIEGEAGIGKSRLVDELVARLQAAGEGVNFLFGSYPPGGAATAAGAFSTAYREHFGAHGLESSLRDYLEEIPLLIPGFAAVLRGETSPAGAEPLTKDSLQTVFVHATQALCVERPTVVLIEDLHFAPDDGRALFASLALGAPGNRLLLLGTTRRGLPPAWVANLERLEYATKLELSRLGPKHLVDLLKDAFGSERLAHELAGKIAVKSDGNPFFAFEIISVLREGKYITRRPDGAWVSTQSIDRIQIPSSVLDLIEARIADLSEEERDLLDVAACCGFEFDATLVGDVIGLRRIPALKQVARIEKRNCLVRCLGEQFAFDHHQIQEALYEALPLQLAREYHAAIADALERRENASAREPAGVDGALAVEVCEHYFKAARGEKALPYLDAALKHLEAGYMNAQYVSLADRALGAPGLLGGERRLDLLMHASTRLDLLGRREDERATLDEALELADSLPDPRRQAAVLYALGWHLFRAADIEGAQDVLTRVRSRAAELGDRRIEAMATGNLGLVLHRNGRYAEAREHHDRHLELARALGDPDGEAKATMNVGLALHRIGRQEEAREHYERTLTIARDAGLRWIESLATGNLGGVYHDLGRYDEARAQHERHLALAREIGDRRGEVMATGNLGWIIHVLGNSEEARTHFSRQLSLAGEIGDRRGESLATGNLGIVFRALGRHEEARAHHERHIALSRELGDRRGEAIATGNLGNVFHSLGHYARARKIHERHLELCREIGYRKGEALSHQYLGNESRHLGDTARARAHLEAGAELAREIGYRSLESDLALVLASLDEGAADPGAARRRYDAGVAIAREIGAENGVASALCALGGFLLRQELAEDAAPHLEEALRLAQGAGAPGSTVLASCLLARLPGGDAVAARSALSEHDRRLGFAERMEAHFLLWRATASPGDLEQARWLLDTALDRSPECREAMLANVPLHRDIAAAWDAQGGSKC